MLNTTHVNDEESQNISTELAKTQPDITSTAKETLDFYLKDPQYTEVHIVRCNRCKSDLCLEVLNPNEAPRYLTSHTKGCRRIVLGTSGPLLSSRKRLDGLMGYRCICGNNTIIADIEKGVVPQVKAPILHIPSIEPHHEALVKLQMAKDHYKPDIDVSDDGKTIRQETFTTTRLK
jgi:hypothetical protein